MRVYKIKTQGETDVVACNGEALDLLKFYLTEIDGLLEDIDEVIEVPQEKWKEMTITFEEPEIGSVTVEEYMQGHTWNEIISSTAN